MQRGGQGNKKPIAESTSFQNQWKKLKKRGEEQHAIASILLPGKCLHICKIIPQHCALEI
jgi:hypothetical protein